jgi:D-alanyl-lipoteichoic acid acyltransferase DltB (MBOAT superfamily)
MLCLFKYSAAFQHLGDAAAGLSRIVAGSLDHWLAGGVSRILAPWDVSWTIADPGALLPIGMSFYLFQSLSYTIGYYRGEVDRQPSLLCYAAFVALFPQLRMGPIERAKNMLPQLGQSPTVTLGDAADGLSLFVVGLFKKIVLADWLALYVDKVYVSPSQHQAPALILATVAFAWQIYFDFSGYSDMARGIARTLGIRLTLNFNNPYLATGLGDFWRRWHISLSTWFRDYVYIPLGGSRRGVLLTYWNMLLTMFISGLWHGATWNFAVWGAVHGLGRIATRRIEESEFYRLRVPRAVKTILVFLFVCFAWIFFKAATMDEALLILGRIARFAWSDPAFPLLFAGLTAAVWAYQAVCESRWRTALEIAPVRIALTVLLIVCTAVFARSGVRDFIYSQF